MGFASFNRGWGYALGLLGVLALSACGSSGSTSGAQVLAQDASGPLVLITSPDEGAYITTANYETFALSGFCSENGGQVQVDAGMGARANTTCVANAWQVSLDVSFLFDGTLTVTVNHRSSDGTLVAPTVTRTFIKDTVSPTGNTVVIGDGVTPPTGPIVTLHLTSTGASTVYVTNTAGCLLNGQSLPFAPTVQWTLVPVGNIATVFVLFKDAAGNASPCLSTSITTNFGPPPSVAITAPPAGSFINAANAAAFTLSGTCSEAGQPVVISGGANATVNCAAGAWSSTLNLSAAADGNVSFTATHANAVGLSSSATATYVKDTMAPTGTVAINNGDAMTASTAVTLTLNSAGGATSMYVTNTAGCLAGGVFENYATTKSWTLLQTTGTATVYATFRDAAGNVGPCVSDTIVVSQPQPSPTPSPGPSSSSVPVKLAFDGSVRAIAIDGDGNRYYGGSFNRIQGTTTPGLIGLLSSGMPSGAMNPGIGFDGAVHSAIYLPDGSLVLGGEFTSYRGMPAHSIARLGANGDLDLTFSPSTSANGFDGTVQALAFEPTTNALYVGGSFRKYRGAPATGLAKLNLLGQLDTVFNPSAGTGSTCVDASVLAIAVRPGALVIGGNFTTYRGAPARSLAKIDPSTGVLDTVFNPTTGANGVDGEVHALAMNGTNLFVGGTFSKYRGASARGIAKVAMNGALDTTFSPSNLGGNGGCGGNRAAVHAIALQGSTLAIAGEFSSYRGMPASNVALLGLDGTLDTEFNPAAGDNGTDGAVYALAFDDTKLYLAGSFSKYRSSVVNGIARAILDTGAADSAFTSLGFSHDGATPAVQSLALLDDDHPLVAAGDLAGGLYGGTITGRLVKVKASGEVDSAFFTATKVDRDVNAISISGQMIYIGGAFRSVGGKIANRVAKLSPAGALDTGFSPQSGANGVDNTVDALAAFQDKLYLGGDFKTYRGTASTRLARVTSAGMLEPIFDCSLGMNGTVRALLVAQNGATLYAGGDFTLFKNAKANHIAKIDTATSTLDTTFNPQTRTTGSNGADSAVYALALSASGTQIYVGGSFSKYRGTAVNRIVRLDADGSLDNAFFPEMTSTCGSGLSSVNAIAVDSSAPNRIFFGGRFADINGIGVNHVTRVSDTGQTDASFSPSSGAAGVNLLVGGATPVQALAIDGPRLHIGGEFTSYRQKPVQDLAVTDLGGMMLE